MKDICRTCVKCPYLIALCMTFLGDVPIEPHVIKLVFTVHADHVCNDSLHNPPKKD
jgi:hypothetical protein